MGPSNLHSGKSLTSRYLGFLDRYHARSPPQETQESVRETLESQPIVEQRQYGLGTDAEGYSYIHFPQFCGQDLRVYRVRPVPQPKWDRPKVSHAEKTVRPVPPQPKWDRPKVIHAEKTVRPVPPPAKWDRPKVIHPEKTVSSD